MAPRRALSEEMVTMRTKCNRMDLIKNLNLWGNDLDDISVVQCMPNLEVLSLSVNYVNTLADLKYCPKLAELYLRKNDIQDLAEVLNLRHLRKMRVLGLSENPCAQLPHYRQYVLHHLPGLTKLDSQDVTDGERHQAAEADLQLSCLPTRVANLAHEDPNADVYASSTLAPQRRGSDLEVEDQHLCPADRTHSSSIASNALGRNGETWQDEHAMRNGAMEPHWQERSPCARPMPVSPVTAWGGGSPQTLRQPRRHGSSGGSPGDSCAAIERAARRSNTYPFPGSGYTSAATGGHEPSPLPQLWGEEMEAAPAQPLAATDNILCAVLALIKELDTQGLELVRRAVEQRQEDAL